MGLGKQVIWRWVVVAIIVMSAMTWGYFIMTEERHVHSNLPFYGQKNDDSSYHTVDSFQLLNHDGRTVTDKDFEDKIYVADFFFTTCPGICPIMTEQLVRVAEKYKSDERVRILSHTVKPEEDSLPVLKEYALAHNADPEKWFFVTADKNVINKLAVSSYLVTGFAGDTEEDFVHTQFFALIDTEKRIRGFYDGTISTEVDKLMIDMDALLHER